MRVTTGVWICVCVLVGVFIRMVARTDLFFQPTSAPSLGSSLPSRRPLPATPTLVIYGCNGRGPQEGPGSFGGRGGGVAAQGRRLAGRWTQDQRSTGRVVR